MQLRRPHGVEDEVAVILNPSKDEIIQPVPLLKVAAFAPGYTANKVRVLENDPYLLLLNIGHEGPDNVAFSKPSPSHRV